MSVPGRAPAAAHAPANWLRGARGGGSGISPLRQGEPPETEQTKSKPKRRYAREPMPASASVDRPTAGATSPTAPRETKIGKVVELLKREQGASLDQIVTATGWLPHTARAAMTGLKKKGHTIERTAVDGVSLYCITASA